MNFSRYRNIYSFRTLALSLSFLITVVGAPQSSQADSVTLKNGEAVEGRIVAENDDMVRIEVQVSGSIKETKTYPMAEVAKIVKTPADIAAFAAIKVNVPTPDLMSSADYNQMIRTGAQRFLTTFPDSKHVAEVKEIIVLLEEEKEKVQLGAIKLNGEWIPREERQLYRFAIEARIRHNRMRQSIGAKDLLGAMRAFETIEERYQETPAHAAALRDALAILPSWGQNLERQLGNVKFLNERDAEQIKNLKPDEQAQIEQAQAAEKARYERAVASEKDQGIEWISVNFRSSESLQDGIDMAQTALKRLKGIDLAALTLQSQTLDEANRLIGEGNLSRARAKIAAATGTGSSRSNSRSSASSPTRYSQWLLGQIAQKERTIAEEAAAALERASALVKTKDEPTTDEPTTDEPTTDEPTTDEPTTDEPTTVEPTTDGPTTVESPDKETTGGEEEVNGEDEDAKPQTRAEILAAERERAAAKRAEEADKKPKPKPPTPTKTSDKKKDVAKEPSGGGINFKYIVWAIAGILVITVIVLKVKERRAEGS